MFNPFKIQLIMEKVTFQEKEDAVTTRSQAYINSSAFQKAMEYVSQNARSLYVDLIELEYKEAFG